MKKKEKIIVIIGQTATGKRALAVKLARRFNGEIISADSRQVYKGMDIGTDKITRKEMCRIPHYLLDIADPRRQFSVALYKKMAEEKIREISTRKKIPILVGGTGFYISAITNDFTPPPVPPNTELRKKLSKLSPARLMTMLKKLDPERALTVEVKNPRRIIRAIEIARAIGKVPSIKKISKYKVLFIGLTIPQEMLKTKIKYRFLKNLKNGLLKETSRLRQRGLSWKRLESFGLYYKYATFFLQKKISPTQMMDSAVSGVWQYARRQRTWFKRDQRIKWFNSGDPAGYKKICGAVKQFLLK